MSQSRHKLSQKLQKNKNKLSQENPETTEDNRDTIDDLSKKCVRFFLTKIRSNLPIKRAEIVQHVFQERPGKSYELVVTAAARYLKEIYGLNLEITDSDTSTKRYFISNNLPFAQLVPHEFESDIKTTITFLVLTHIFMSKNNSTDINLWNFLKEFDITPRTECKTIGSMKLFITQTLVKQHYIIVEDRDGEHEDGEPKKRFRWGPRADEVASKMKILKFISQLYGDQNIEFWRDQYKAAKEQFAGCDQ